MSGKSQPFRDVTQSTELETQREREMVSRGWWGVWDSGKGALAEFACAQLQPSFLPDP